MADSMIDASVRIDLPADKALRLECLNIALRLGIEIFDAEHFAKLSSDERRSLPAAELVKSASTLAAFVLQGQSGNPDD